MGNSGLATTVRTAAAVGFGILASGWAGPAYGQAAAATCAEAVQGEIAWNYQGNTRWARGNVERLCRGAENSVEPARCFDRVMHGGVSRGEATRWRWQDALALCQGTRDADATVTCFERQVVGHDWEEAVEACRPDPESDAGARPVTELRQTPAAVGGDGAAAGEGELVRIQAPPNAAARVVTASDLRERVDLAGAVTPSDLEEIEPADMDFHRAAEAPPELSWSERMDLLEEAGVAFEPLPEPPEEFTLSPREHYVSGAGHLQFKNPVDLNPLTDRALMPDGARGAVEVHVRAREAGRYLLVFRTSSREDATYAMWIGDDNPAYTRDAGSQTVSFVLHATEPGDISGLFYCKDAAFTFHGVTVTRVE